MPAGRDRLAHEGRWRTFFPEVWQWYLDRTPPEHHDDPSGFHLAQVLGDDEKAGKGSAYASTTADSAVMELHHRFKAPPFEDDFDPVPARLRAHYMSPERAVLDLLWGRPGGLPHVQPAGGPVRTAKVRRLNAARRDTLSSRRMTTHPSRRQAHELIQGRQAQQRGEGRSNGAGGCA